MTLARPRLDQPAESAADPWANAESWPSSWPSFGDLVLGVTSGGEVVGRTPYNATPRVTDHVVAALAERRRTR